MGWSKTAMDKTSAACAMDWSIELEKGLRSKRPGEPLDTISQVGPRICRWSREPIVTMAMTDMFGLVQGEDRLFANAILLRLADAFRSGDNNLRACILKVFLLEMKNRKRCKQYNGILAKQRVPNYIELLKRVKVVFDTGDVESRALSLRLLGCWAYLAKDSAEIRYMILTSLESCQILELKASLFAAGCFCELSEDFAFVVLEKLKSMLISLTTSLDTKLAVARVFSNMRCSYLIANRAYKIGKSLALDSSEEEFLIKMLWSLSKLASKSILLIPEQVDLLLSFLSCKSSASVSAAAVRCLFLLSVGGISQFPVNASVILTLLHMLDNGDVPLKSQCEAIEILHKVFHFSLLPPNVDVHEFHKLVLIAESVAQSPTVSNRLPVLGLLVDVSCSLKRKMTNCCCYYPDQTSQNSLQDSVVVPDRNGLESLPWRVSVLVMDQITFLIQQVNLESHMAGFTTTSKPKAENVSSKVKQECQCFLNLMLHLVQNYPILGLMALTKVRWLGESFVNMCHTLGIETADNHEVSGMDMDTENSSSSSHKLTEFEGGRHASALEIVICLCQFTVFCLEMLDEVNAVTDEIYDTVKLLVECIQQSGFLNSNMLVIFSLIVHSRRMRQCFGCENFTFDSAFQNMCHDDCWVDHELMTLEFAKKMMTGSDFWAVYRTGKYAACQGAWFAATFAFRIIIKRAESDACRDWLKSLALFAGAESEIQLLLFPGQGIKLIQGLQKNRDREETSADDDVGNADLSDFIGKLSTAFNRICSAVKMLEADVTLNLPFYFQRWFLSLRAKVLGTMMDIFGLLTSSADAKESMDGNGQLLLQHMHSLASDFNHLSFRLNKFAKEFDLLATSFMDIDPKSFRFISRFALNCSLLAFCTTYIIQFSNLPAYKNSVSSTLEGQEKYSPAVVIQDLVERLWNIDSKTCTDLQLFSNLAREKSGYLQSRTQISSTGHRERATLMFCRFAISVVLKMEQEAKRVKDEEDLAQFLQAGLKLLFDIVRQWLHLPFHTPKYFFRVRPCFGAKLFAFNADAQNPGAMSIVSGFCLSLNLCMQMNYPSTKGDVDVTKLYCILAVKRSDCQPIGNGESKRQEQMDFDAWKTDDAVDLNEELLLYVRNTCKSQRMHGAASNGDLVTAFVCFEPNERGQGFSTCLLDVSSFPEGSYQIKWQGCCIDGKGSYWSLLPLNAGPVLNVEPPATTI